MLPSAMNALAVTLPPSFPPLPHSSHESFNHFSIVYILKNFSLHKSKFCGILNISTKMHRKVGVFKIHGENSFVQFLKSRSNRSSSSHFGTMSGSGPFQQAIICFIPFCLRFKFWQQLQPQTYPSSPRHFRSTSLAHFPEFFARNFFFSWYVQYMQGVCSTRISIFNTSHWALRAQWLTRRG